MTEQENKDRYRFFDHEMPEEEASAFYNSLSSQDQKRLDNERGFETSLKQFLEKDDGCPDVVWRRLQMQLRNMPEKKRLRSYRWPLRLAAAAVLTLAVLVGIQQTDQASDGDTFLRVAEANVVDLADLAQTEQPTIEHVQHFLSSRGFTLQIPSNASFSAHTRHDVKLLGARCDSCPMEDIGEILFNCCGQPVKIVLAHKGGRAANLLQTTCSKDKCGCEVQCVADMGDYLVAVVGRHHCPQLLEMLIQNTAESRN